MKPSNRANRRTLSRSFAAASEPLEQRRLLASIVVNSAADNAIAGDGLTTLREAIIAANATPAVADTITFNLGAGAHTINLAGALPNFATDITIQGPGADLLTIRRDTGGDYRIFTSSGNFSVSGITIANGTAFNGGGIFSQGGALSVLRCTIIGNAAYYGGGICGETMTVQDTTFIGNTAQFSGGAILTFGQESTSALIRQCTFTGNRAVERSGGAISAESRGHNTIALCTITANVGAGGYQSFGTGAGGVNTVGAGGTTTIRNCIIAGNTTTAVTYPELFDVGGPFDGGFNFIGGDPKLGPLADNGGPTKTMALLPGSTAINRGDPNFTGPPVFDQRGAPYARKIGPRIDIGAFESDVLNATPTTDGLGDLTVPEDAADNVVNLRNFFDDAEDGPNGLVYTVVDNTNPGLFASTSIDDATDALTLDYADDAHGVVTITVRATDAGGAYVESTFTVTVLSVQQQVELLVQRVNALPGLNQGNRTALLVRLNLNGSSGDAPRIQSFVETVEAFAAAGRIAASDAHDLISAAANLMISAG